MPDSYCLIKLPTFLHDKEFHFALVKVSKEKDMYEPSWKGPLLLPLQGET